MRRDLFALPPPLVAILRDGSFQCVVTGGDGWLGRCILEVLDNALGDQLASRVRAYSSCERVLTLLSGRKMTCQPIERLADNSAPEMLIFHCAFATRERASTMPLEDYAALNRHLAECVGTAMARTTVRGLFIPSSGAVYQRGARSLDDDLVANPYGVLKGRDEAYFAPLASGFPLCMPRIFNLAGPFINKIDIYVIASLIRAALTGQPLQIQASHRVVRSYVHVLDVLTLAFSMLLTPHPDDVAVFDTRGDESLEIGDLARRICNVLRVSERAITRPPLVSQGKGDTYVGQGEPMTTLMRQHGLTMHDMTTQILDTADYLQTLPQTDEA